MAIRPRRHRPVVPGPGQPGARHAGHGRRHAPDLLELAGELVGSDPFERVDEGTRFAQPAIYCAALAGWERLGRPEADCAAGHSLGEVAALAVAGALDHHDGLRLAVRRGRADAKRRRACRGGMLALLGEREAAIGLAGAHS